MLFDFSSENTQCAIESKGFSCSYKQLHTLLSSFDAKNVTEKKVALIGESDPFVIIAYFALIHKGIEVAILNPKLPLSILRRQLQELSIKTLYVRKKLALANVDQRICEDSFSSFELPKNPSFSQICTYLYTSGSTKKPKIAALSFQNHYYSAKGILKTLSLTQASRYLLCLPLYHVSGLSILYRTFLCKGTLVIPSLNEPLSTSIQETKITHVSLVSAQLSSILRKGSLNSLQAVLVGGSSISNSLLNEAIEQKLPLFTSYGMTEMASTITCLKIRNKEQLGFAGNTLPFRRLQITKNKEILVGGKTLFAGYYNPKTQKIEKPSSLFSTKDLGDYQKGKGLSIEKRKDHMFISGGENIHPEEIEQVLMGKKEIKHAVIVPIDDERFGKVGVAFIQTEKTFDPLEIKDFLGLHLPSYKIPKQILAWPAKIECSTLKITKKVRDALLQHLLSS